MKRMTIVEPFACLGHSFFLIKCWIIRDILIIKPLFIFRKDLPVRTVKTHKQSSITSG